MADHVILNDTNKTEYFRQTEEYIFLDEIDVIPGQSASGVKRIFPNEWYFSMHFPGNPVMPGVFQMEAIMQTGGVIINTQSGEKELELMFLDANTVKIKQSARPGDILKTFVELISYKRGIATFEGKAYTNGVLSCEMNFRLIAPSEMVVIGRKND